MKKNLTHLAGIVFFIAILAAGSINPAQAQEDTTKEKKVTIYVKAVKIDGENHLRMYEVDDEGKVSDTVTDDLTTLVDPGTEVVWRRAPDSGIKRFIRVTPKDLKDNVIFPQPAATILFYKRMRHYVPSYAPKLGKDDEPIKEKYIIEVLDNNGSIWSIDPYLQIPRNQ